MKECDNSTRKIHISSNFILSISLLIMFDTLLLRPSLHCNTPLHFTTLHQLHFTTLIDTSLPSHLALHIYISYRSISPHITTLDTVQFYFTSHHYTRHSTVLISKLATVRSESQYVCEVFFSPLQPPDRLWGPHSPLSNVCWSSLTEVMRPGREMDHSPPSSV